MYEEYTGHIQDIYGTYTGHIQDINGVEEICRGELYIPNAFTPNKDGLNDIFLPKCDNLDTYSLEIYNRWGELVFSTTNSTIGWDGTFKGSPCNADTYIYIIKYMQSGQSMDNLINGNLTLLR